MINSKVVKKLLISFFASIILLVSILSLFARPVSAQSWYGPSFEEFTARVFDDSNPDEIFGERYTYAQVVWIFHSLTAILVPDILLACFTDADVPGVSTCLGEVVSIIPGIDLGYSVENANLADTFDTVITKNPVSGVGYIMGIASKFHIIPEAKAQGFGFDNLGAIRAIWASTRNIAYFLLIFAFIIMAFMIMFRIKISPQTVISVQSALPRLVLILILITFSYAIAGLMVDLSYVAIGLFAIIAGSDPSISNLGTLDLFNVLIGLGPIIVMFIIPLAYLLGLLLFGGLSLIPVIGQVLFLIPAIIMLLLTIVFVIVWLRMLWLMVKTFVNVILLIIASPIFILIGVFPAGGGFGAWLRNLASHLAVFPTIIIMIFLAHYLFWSNLSSTGIGEVFASVGVLNPYGIKPSPSSGPVSFPGFSLATEIVGFVASFGILFLIPSIGNIIQGLISGRPFSYGTAIGAAFGPVGTLWGAEPVRATREAMSREGYGRALERGGKFVRRRVSRRLGEGMISGAERLYKRGERYRS